MSGEAERGGVIPDEVVSFTHLHAQVELGRKDLVHQCWFQTPSMFKAVPLSVIGTRHHYDAVEQVLDASFVKKRNVDAEPGFLARMCFCADRPAMSDLWM